MNLKNSSRGFGIIAIIIAIAVVAAAGGGVYYASKNPVSVDVDANATTTTDMSSNSDASASTTVSVDLNTSTSLRKLLAGGKNVVCTFDQTVTNSQSSGTVYISGSDMRGDFTSKTSAGTVESHMITTGGTAYVWSNASTQGMKMSVTETQANAQSQAAVDLDANLSYNCSNWTADRSKFSLPSTVTFLDLSTMIQGAAGVKIPSY